MPITIQEIFSTFPSSRLFYVNFHGTRITVTVTADPFFVRRWIKSTRWRYRRYLRRLVVGLGVQWTSGKDTIDEPAGTLQLCVGNRCLVYQLSHSHQAPNLLRRFLKNPDISFVGFWNHLDRMKQFLSIHELTMPREQLLDLRYYMKSAHGGNNVSVEELVRKCLGIPGVIMSREISKSDWDNPHLSHDQIRQVTLGAHCAFKIGRKIRAWKKKKTRDFGRKN